MQRLFLYLVISLITDWLTTPKPYEYEPDIPAIAAGVLLGFALESLLISGE